MKGFLKGFMPEDSGSSGGWGVGDVIPINKLQKVVGSETPKGQIDLPDFIVNSTAMADSGQDLAYWNDSGKVLVSCTYAPHTIKVQRTIPKTELPVNLAFKKMFASANFIILGFIRGFAVFNRADLSFVKIINHDGFDLRSFDEYNNKIRCAYGTATANTGIVTVDMLTADFTVKSFNSEINYCQAVSANANGVYIACSTGTKMYNHDLTTLIQNNTQVATIVHIIAEKGVSATSAKNMVVGFRASSPYIVYYNSTPTGLAQVTGIAQTASLSIANTHQLESYITTNGYFCVLNTTSGWGRRIEGQTANIGYSSVTNFRYAVPAKTGDGTIFTAGASQAILHTQYSVNTTTTAVGSVFVAGSAISSLTSTSVAWATSTSKKHLQLGFISGQTNLYFVDYVAETVRKIGYSAYMSLSAYNIIDFDETYVWERSGYGAQKRAWNNLAVVLNSWAYDDSAGSLRYFNIVVSQNSEHLVAMYDADYGYAHVEQLNKSDLTRVTQINTYYELRDGINSMVFCVRDNQLLGAIYTGYDFFSFSGYYMSQLYDRATSYPIVFVNSQNPSILVTVEDSYTYAAASYDFIAGSRKEWVANDSIEGLVQTNDYRLIELSTNVVWHDNARYTLVSKDTTRLWNANGFISLFEVIMNGFKVLEAA